MATLNTALTTSSGMSVSMQSYYDRKLLTNAKDKLVFYQYAQKRVRPKNNGKVVQFRKWTPFAALTTALTEGTVPDGQSLAMTEVTATCYAYGGYVAVETFLDLTALDPVINDAVGLMGDQAGLSLDTLVRDAMALTDNVQYANSRSYIYELRQTDILNTTEIRKAVRTLKKNKAPMFNRGGKDFYIAVVDADMTYDLQSDTKWENVSLYQDKENIYSGEIGRLYGVVFVESTNNKIYENAELIGGQVYLTISAITGAEITVKETITSGETAALLGKYVNVYNTATVYERELITAVTAATAGQIKLAAAPTGFTAAANDVLYANTYGFTGNDVHACMIFGREAYAAVEIAGNSNIKSLVKPAGSAGTADPLNQINTVGWKIEAFAAKVLQEAWIVKILCGVSDS